MGTSSLTVGSFSPSVLLRLARRTGRLEQQRLVVHEIPVPSSPAQFRSLLDGELDAVLTSPDNVIAYRYSPSNPLGFTADARIVAAIDGGLGLALYGRPGKTSPADVIGPDGPAGRAGRAGPDNPDSSDGATGLRFGVDVPTSGFAFALYALAESIGLNQGDYELLPLGSTPKRLEALLAGHCDATMLNAGNELRAEQAGCCPIVRLSDVCSPYLGTVLAVVGDAWLEPAMRLAQALRATAESIRSGDLDDEAGEEAAAALGLTPELARRHVARLKDPVEGLIVDGRVAPESLRTVVDLRRRYRPSVRDGVDLLAAALVPESGLLSQTR